MSSGPFLPHYIAERAKVLEDAGIESGKAEMEWILCHVLKMDRLNLYLHGSAVLSDEAKSQIEEIIARRRTRYPLQFILEESWFYGRKFYVTPTVMAPTPETEGLCETAIDFAGRHNLRTPRILDVGVGSGVITVTMAAELDTAEVIAVDISAEALAVARKNVEAHGVAGRVTLIESDFFSSVPTEKKFDLILSNPPYIREADYPTLQREVLEDPKIAMTAGEDGLDAIRAIVKNAPRFLAPGGRAMFEIGMGQSSQVARLAQDDRRYSSFTSVTDLNDIDRIVILACDE